ncbi:sphingolipid long chain base-responsive protein LSP1 [Ophiocordyceps sinensis CO18]|uniref:Sphingolipid long chain base-responsive protein LSP1 n=1 Tax=Ophiocordyceps sinensis (strain Co18 / CGMCC 3.14243) TaxID=911162 RepID=T5ACQ4_OPHSC|nr:sphingolipid long chain base-responsive protein LSP1 [Ophiocordyceps sinensis CO18]
MSRCSADDSFAQFMFCHHRYSRPDATSNSSFFCRNRALSIRSGGKANKSSATGTSGGRTGTSGGRTGTSGGRTGTSGGRTGTSGGRTGTSGGRTGTSGGRTGTSGGRTGTSGGRTVKSENNLITAHETAGRERIAIAQQLSDWGEQTGDDGVNDVSDKVGVILSEMGEQEDSYAHALDESRGRLKSIRNTEKSVQPSRDGKVKITDEIAKLKSKEPESTKLVVLEQELVRAEAENLVAEAQLTNVTRQKLKEAYEVEFAATIERAEKQIILARHGRRLLALLDDTPVVPGDDRQPYARGQQARQILNDCEDDLREWQPDQEAYLDAAESPSSFKGKDKEVLSVPGNTGARAHEDLAGADGLRAAEIGA